MATLGFHSEFYACKEINYLYHGGTLLCACLKLFYAPKESYNESYPTTCSAGEKHNSTNH